MFKPIHVIDTTMNVILLSHFVHKLNAAEQINTITKHVFSYIYRPHRTPEAEREREGAAVDGHGPAEPQNEELLYPLKKQNK
jgi:hypothetical protein